MEDIVYFRDLVNFETRRLEFLCEAWNNKFTEGRTPEEETGHILSVIGKIILVSEFARFKNCLVGQTRLLMKEKFKQFSELIEVAEKSINEEIVNEKVTLDDLQGFWDLISIQTEDMNNKFAILEKLELNNWHPVQDTSPAGVTHTKKKLRKAPNKTTDDPARRRLAAAKQVMKSRLTSEDSVE